MNRFVIADIEWVKIGDMINVTQLGCVRVDGNWSVLDRFYEPVKQKEKMLRRWKKSTFAGNTENTFLSAKTIFKVFEQFEKWLSQDEIILWWDRAGYDTFSQVLKNTCNRAIEQRQLILREVISLSGKVRGNLSSAYTLAKELNIAVNGVEHNALCDATIVSKVLKRLNLSKEIFDKMLEKRRENAVPKIEPQANLAYEFSTNLFHIKDGGCQYHGSVIPGEFLANYIKMGANGCSVCAKKAFLQAKKKVCREIIKEKNCDFVYAKGAQVFHSARCNLIGLTMDYVGAKSYKEALDAGKRPCKRCLSLLYDGNEKCGNKMPTSAASDEAIEELKRAHAEGKLTFFRQDECTLSEGEKDNSGHLKRKKRKAKVNDIAMLFSYCNYKGFACFNEGKYFRVETPVGKWKIDMNATPIRIKHINLVCGRPTNRYHSQNVSFSTCIAAARYIFRHDDRLKKGGVVRYFENDFEEEIPD